MTGPDNRRPLRSRQTAWAQAAARRIDGAGITPNMISAGAVLAAVVGGGSLALVGLIGDMVVLRGALLLVAALAIQARLLCNLFDGLVAIEGGKAAKDGPFWNEAPDRLADILFFAGAGIAAGHPALGWSVAALAVLTAYLRELGRAEGLPPDFRGPMAKQHRMAALTLACLLAVVEPMISDAPRLLAFALWIIAIGTIATATIRATRMVGALKAR